MNVSGGDKFEPIIGEIVSLPELHIRVGSKVDLKEKHILATFDLYETIEHETYTEYVNLNKKVVLLPYADFRKFIAIGVLK